MAFPLFKKDPRDTPRLDSGHRAREIGEHRPMQLVHRFRRNNRPMFYSSAVTVGWSLLIGCILGMVWGPAALADSPQALGPSFEVSSDRDLRHSDARISSREDGSFLVVWHEIREDQILGRLFASDGSPLAEQFQINSELSAILPTVESTDDGQFVVTYVSAPDEYPTEQLWDLRGRIVDASGRLSGEEFTIEDSPEVNSGAPAVATLADGEFVVVWKAEVSVSPYVRDYSIRGRRYLSDGTAAGESFLVIEDPTRASGSPDVAALDSGDYVVVWNTAPGIFGRRYAAAENTSDGSIPDGIPTEPFAIHQQTALVLRSPRLAAMPGDEFVVSWLNYQGAMEGGGSLRARQFDGDGTPLGGEIEVVTGLLDDFQRASISSLGRDGFVVTWDDPATLMRAFRADGTPRGEVVGLPSEVRQDSQDVANLGDGRFIVTWERRDSSPFMLNIYGQLFTTRCVPSESRLCLGEAGQFEAWVVWRDHQNGRGEGHLVPVQQEPGASNASGLFWFFDPDNWEMLVKAIDGCDFNGHHWIFAAAITDVEFELTVEDTVSGQSKTYSNPLGRASDAVTDTAAFATCP